VYELWKRRSRVASSIPQLGRQRLQLAEPDGTQRSHPLDGLPFEAEVGEGIGCVAYAYPEIVVKVAGARRQTFEALRIAESGHQAVDVDGHSAGGDDEPTSRHDASLGERDRE
jgi:hypothetical protein